MVDYVDDFIGRQLKRMKESGEMDDNPYAGKPFDLEGYFKAPKETRAINKMLVDAGFKPPKLQALMDLRKKEQEYESNPSEELRAEIIQLRLKYQVLR